MELIRVRNPSAGAEHLHATLVEALASGAGVLWFISGGSNIAITSDVLSKLDPTLLPQLTVALIDERYGPVGHADSNWTQLQQALRGQNAATYVPILKADADLATTAKDYAEQVEQLLARSSIVIGQFGIGPDGHTAGILPNTPSINAQGLVTAYHTEKFDRISCTFNVLTKCSVAFVFAFGDDKYTALNNLSQDLSLQEQPAQIFKQLPEVYIYNDQIGETS